MDSSYGTDLPADLSWSWLRDKTRGRYHELDNIGDTFGDHNQITWNEWSNFWIIYETTLNQNDWIPITNIPATVEGDEDVICPNGYFKNDARKCYKCPPGCSHCTKPHQCLECSHSFELVSGDGFSHCFMGCLHGQFRVTEYSNQKELLDSFTDDGLSRAGFQAAIPPHEMLETCQKCPENCTECYDSHHFSKTVCTKCKMGTELD